MGKNKYGYMIRQAEGQMDIEVHYENERYIFDEDNIDKNLYELLIEHIRKIKGG